MEFTFEDKIRYIEEVLGVYLLDWQKKALKQINEGIDGIVWIPGRASGRTVYAKAVQILNKLNESLENNEGWENDNPTFKNSNPTKVGKEYDMYFT